MAPAVVADCPMRESMAACPVLRLLGKAVVDEYSVSPRSPTTSKVSGVEVPTGSRVVKVWRGVGTQQVDRPGAQRAVAVLGAR